MDIYELLNKIVTNKCFELSPQLFMQANTEQLDENDKHLFDIFKNISSLGIEISSSGIKFHPMFIMANGQRTFAIEDITDSDYKILQSVDYNRLPLTLAAFVLPGVEQMENDLLHLLRGVVLGEIPLHILLIEEELLPLVGLFLGEQVMQVFPGQSSRLAHLFEGAGLGEGWCGLTGVHFFLEHPLMLLGQVGDFYRRIEGDLVFVHHLEDGGNQVGQADVAMNLSLAVVAILTDLFHTP